MTELETIVLDWLAKLLALPPVFLSTGPTHGGGVIQGSASEAVLTAMVAAREKYLLETTPPNTPPDSDLIWTKRSKLVAIATSATHSSTKKAAQILGIRFVTIPVTSSTSYALTSSLLTTTLTTLLASGLEPFFLTATLGTTDTCSVDSFSSVLASLNSHPFPPGSPGELWIHIDAAYAGAALVLPQIQSLTQIHLTSSFHSFNLNMHKWLLTNFDASCLYVRNRKWFTQALSINQAVYDNSASDGGLVTDYREWQIPLGRRFRALKIWFVLRSYGAEGLRSYIQRTIKLGEDFADAVGERGGLFEILTGPSFALTVFRMVGEDDEKRNERTKRLCDAVNGSGKMWVTSTVLDGQLAIRFMTGARTTEKEHVDAAFKMFVDVAEEIVKGG